MIPHGEGSVGQVSGTHDAIRRVVEAFERSDWTEIDVRAGEVRVHLAAGTGTDAGVALRSERAADPTAGPGAARDLGPAPTQGDDAPPPPFAAPDGAHVVTAPSPGIFWRSPEPGAPPFADVGDTVTDSSTLCIVEVMKLMNHLKSGVAGEVVAVYPRDGVAVRKGEPLFAVVPSGPST